MGPYSGMRRTNPIQMTPSEGKLSQKSKTPFE